MISLSHSMVRILLATALASGLSACGGSSGSDGTGVIASSKTLTASSAIAASSVAVSAASQIIAQPSSAATSAADSSATVSSATVTTPISSSEASVLSSAVSSSSYIISSPPSSSSVMIVSSPASSSSSSIVSSPRSSSSSSIVSSPRSSIPSSSSSSSSSSVIPPAVSSSSRPVYISSIRLSVAKTELIVGEQVVVSVTGIYPDGSTTPNASTFWFVGNRSVIAGDGGVVGALSVGESALGADAQIPGGSVGSNTLFFKVKEAPGPVQAIHLGTAESGPLMLGNLGRLKVTADYAGMESIVLFNPAVTFAVANPEIVEILDRGFIKPRAAGKTTITATYQGKTATYAIEVVPLGAVFHLLKPDSWKPTLNVHWFAPKVLGVTAEKLSTFPGSPMQDLDADGWYDITLTGVQDINVLFNDGGATSAGFKQTTDQYIRSGGWFVPDEFPNAEGKYYGTWYDTKPTLLPQEVCDVKTFGAKGDGATKDTVAIQKAIDACAGKNGIVRLRGGKFVSGTIVLKSDMTLRIEPGATLLGTRDAADYPDQPKLSGNSQYRNCRKALIYSERAKNIRIDGGGTIDGNGGNGSPWMTGLEATRPMAIFLVQTDGIVLQNITVKNSAMWTVVPFESSNITIRGVTVNSLTGHNLDGIDIVDGRKVLIEAVDITSQDDAICLKSGSAELGVYDVMVRYSKVNRSTVANGLKFGTATSGSFQDITFDNISLNNVTRGGIAVESVDGSRITRIAYRNITMDKVGTPFYVVLGYRSKDENLEQKVGDISHLTFENIVATNTTKTWGSYISGVSIKGETHYLYKLLFKNVDLSFPGGSTNVGTPWEFNADYSGEYPDPGPSTGTANKKDMPGYLYIRHAGDVTLINTKVSVVPEDKRPKVVTEDVSQYMADPL